MTRMAVITPSFAPDFELCADLNRSVLAHSPDSVRHHIIVPRIGPEAVWSTGRSTDAHPLRK